MSNKFMVLGQVDTDDMLSSDKDTSLDKKTVRSALETVNSIEHEINCAKKILPFDSAKMSALAKRIQRLKGLSPIKFELSPPVGRTRGGKESKIENPVVMEVKPSICVTTQQGNPSLLSAPPSGVAAEAIKPEEGKSGSASADLNPTTAGNNEDSFESGSESLEEEEEGESHGGTTDDDTETSKSDGPGDVPFKGSAKKEKDK
ncbi:hypothetical protein U1Q18_040357 [Sarracenia purpurea var. burkii]